MKLHFLPILTFLSVAIVVSHASLPPELYWKQVLLDIDIPKAILTSLPKHDYIESKSKEVNVDKRGAHANIGKVGPEVGEEMSTIGLNGAHTIVKVGPMKKPHYVRVKPNTIETWFIYAAATKDHLNDGPTRGVFMLEKDLKPGYQTSLWFTQSTNGATFLPRYVADSIPFSTDEMSKILEKFSITDPNSEEAKAIKRSVDHCERKSLKGEEKYCATSLESMIDHVTSNLGRKNLNIFSTEIDEKNENKSVKYVVSGVSKIANEGDGEVCHKLNYAYAVFYCHKNRLTTAYMVSLMGKDGSNAKAVVVCHKDTSGWNPQHLAFQVLPIKPGGKPVCHFLPEDHIVWVCN